MIRVEIPLKLPSLNTYINQCRYNSCEIYKENK